MIVSRNFEGSFAPQLIYDICEQAITDDMAAAISRKQVSGEVSLERILHVHKGKCLDAAEEQLGGEDETGWMELLDHLTMLVHNCGISTEKFVKVSDFRGGNRLEP